jgi:hypothetical protein
MLKKRLLFAAVASVVALAGGSAAQARPTHFSPVAIAKSCSASYRHAVIGGAEKCLRAGQYCAQRYDRQYRRYGYRCIKRDYRGSYHLTYA